MRAPQPHILGIGNPLIDYIIPVDRSFLSTFNEPLGGMRIIERERMEQYLDLAKNCPQAPGGSCANTILALQELGCQTSLCGKVGQDRLGLFYQDYLKNKRIRPYLAFSYLPTGCAFCFVDEQAQRTCRTYLGACSTFTSQDLSTKAFTDIEHVHIEGYMLLYADSVSYALKLAKQVGALISLDLSSFEIVHSFRDLLLTDILPNIDILFGNEDEFKALTQSGYSLEKLNTLCPLMIVMQGKSGGIVIHNNKHISYRATKVSVLDTTGAGDFFAAGFLYAYFQQFSLLNCALHGNLLASYVIQYYGAHIPDAQWPIVKGHLMTLQTSIRD